MALRRDALTAAAEAVLVVEAVLCPCDGLVATVGSLSVEPGASNVVPGRATLSVDVRHADDAVRAHAVAEIEHTAGSIAAARNVTYSWTVVQETAAVATAPDLTTLLEESIAALGLPIRRLVSHAGHDAVVMAAVTPVAMLFVPCAGGISHSPDEAVAEEDVAVALDVVEGFLARLGR
jgi:allantoate deiminase